MTPVLLDPVRVAEERALVDVELARPRRFELMSGGKDSRLAGPLLMADDRRTASSGAP